MRSRVSEILKEGAGEDLAAGKDHGWLVVGLGCGMGSFSLVEDVLCAMGCEIDFGSGVRY